VPILIVTESVSEQELLLSGSGPPDLLKLAGERLERQLSERLLDAVRGRGYFVVFYAGVEWVHDHHAQAHRGTAVLLVDSIEGQIRLMPVPSPSWWQRLRVWWRRMTVPRVAWGKSINEEQAPAVADAARQYGGVSIFARVKSDDSLPAPGMTLLALKDEVWAWRHEAQQAKLERDEARRRLQEIEGRMTKAGDFAPDCALRSDPELGIRMTGGPLAAVVRKDQEQIATFAGIDVRRCADAYYDGLKDGLKRLARYGSDVR
jgi:hypothetical protein